MHRACSVRKAMTVPIIEQYEARKASVNLNKLQQRRSHIGIIYIILSVPCITMTCTATYIL